MHHTEQASAWVQRWSHLVPPGGTVLDVACGAGRHLRWFAGRGHPVTGVDRSPEAIAAVNGLGRTVQADIENGPWPFEDEHFGAVVVTNYLWRPLLPQIVASVAEGGVLIYETLPTATRPWASPRGRISCFSPANCCRSVPACGWWPTRTASWMRPSALCSALRRCENGQPTAPRPSAIGSMPLGRMCDWRPRAGSLPHPAPTAGAPEPNP